MRSEQFEHVQKIRQTYLHDSEASKTNQNNAIELLADDLYKKHTHFIFELIQNAEDNTYVEGTPYPPYISFQLTRTDPIGIPGSDGALIIQNNEIGFTCHNVDAICAVGRTTKKKAQGYIGEKGIGFKSVFRVTENPHIFSNGYHFCLPKRDEQIGLGYIVPQWIDTLPGGLDFSQTLIILPLTKADFGYDKIKEMLRDIEPEVILFLSKLKEIRIETGTGADWTILKDDDAKPEVAVVVEGSKQGLAFPNSDDFLVCTRAFDKPADISHEKREEKIKSRDVSIAFPLNENSRSLGKIFAYLPIRSDMDFPFVINADFILTSSREEIQEEDWNRWLIDCVANLVVTEFLPLLKERELLSVSFLEALARWLNNLAEDRNNLFYPIFSRVNEALRNEKFLPANDGTFVSASNAKLARGEPIRNLLSHKQLGDLFESDNKLKWLSDDITQDRTPELRNFLMKLEVEEVRPPMFASRLSKDFLEQQDDTWFVEFYRFLSAHYRDLRYYLPTKPILRLQDGTHVNPSPGEGASPSAYLASEAYIDTPSPIIKVELTQDEEVRGLLRKLGVREREIIDDVMEHVLPKYESNIRIIHVEEHRTDFEKISRVYYTDSQTNRTRLREKLLQTPFILMENTHSERPIYGKPTQLYFGSDELRLYFDGNDSCNFVSLGEYPPSAREFLKELGVRDTVKINKKKPDYEGNVVIKSILWGPYERGLDGFDPNTKVDGLKHALNHLNPEKSEFIWNWIAKPNSNCIRGTIEESTNQHYRNSKPKEQISVDFGRLLIETAWLPDSAGNMHRPCELTLDDLPKSFVQDANLAEQLRMKKNEEAELAKLVGIPVKVIEKLKKPGMLEKFDEFLEREDSGTVEPTGPKSYNPEFPESTVKNPVRRAAMLAKELENLPGKEYKRILRSVRAHSVRETARVWLKEGYTNDVEKMFCQICQKEMPFKKRDGEYYFEAVESLDKEYLPGEREQQFLALCPECAARYQEFIKNDENAMRELIDQLMVSENLQIPLQLGELTAKLHFVETHWRDIKQILESA